MRGNQPVRFLGGGGPAMASRYPTYFHSTHEQGVAGCDRAQGWQGEGAGGVRLGQLAKWG